MAKDRQDIIGVQTLRECLERNIRVECFQLLCCTGRFAAALIGFTKQDLALQVAGVNDIVINDADGPPAFFWPTPAAAR